MFHKQKERIYLQLYDYETKEFSGLTTYHGLVRIYNSNTWPSRIFWSVVVLSCLSLFMIHSGYLLLGYHAKPTLFQVNTIVPANGIHFPDVTICNLNFLNYTLLNEKHVSLESVKYILQYFDEIIPSQQYTLNTENVNKELKRLLETFSTSKKHTIPVFELLMYFSKTCEETFISCQFGPTIFENCCQRVLTEITEHGVCFRIPNGNQSYRQMHSGQQSGWKIVLDDNGDDQIMPQISSDRGFLVMVHEANKYPTIGPNALSVSPNSILHASLTLKNISLLDKLNWGTCSMGWVTNESTLIYTADHCTNRCKQNFFNKLCGCIPLIHFDRTTQLSSVQICSPFDILKCSEKIKDEIHWNENCSCPSECKLLKYDIHNSYTRYLDQLGKTSPQLERTTKNSLSIVNIYFGHVSYELMEQQKQLQTADLLSNIAGSMGLFLGMSTVTLLEIFIYLFKSVWGTVNSNRQKQFCDAVQEEEKERQRSIVIIQGSGHETEGDDIQQIVDLKTFERNEKAPSRNSIHIHLDRRNSRMVRGGDLFTAPRGSVNIPSHLLSPLSKHNRKSMSSGPSHQRFVNSGLIDTALPNETGGDTTTRRNSIMTTSLSTRNRASFTSQPEEWQLRNQRKVSTNAMFKSQLL